VQKKLYLHNMGHAVSAYLGLHAGYQYIYESMENPWLYLCVQNAMIESALALYKQYAATGLQIQDLLAHINDLTYRFQNKALLDTNERVGADPARKLAPSDRLVGAASLALSMGIVPVYIGLGIAAGLHQLEKLQANLEIDGILDPLKQYESGPELVHSINWMVDKIRQDAPVQDLYQAAERDRSRYQMKGDTHE
jgi:mannitol-1-phosphate 5-dehydrogenase